MQRIKINAKSIIDQVIYLTLQSMKFLQAEFKSWVPVSQKSPYVCLSYHKQDATLQKLHWNLRRYLNCYKYCVYMYPSSCSYLKQCFGDWILSQSSGWTFFSWSQLIELVPITGYLHQHKIRYTNQAHHRPFARVKTDIKRKSTQYEA
jgi:hypothetical protein